MATRPGVMIYFNVVRPFLDEMTDDEAGAFFRAVMDYAEYGADASLDGYGKIAFNLMCPIIERDNDRYYETIDKRRYAVYCREAEKRGEKVKTFDEWLKTIT